MRAAPSTFDTKVDGQLWLKAQTRDVDRGSWQPPVRQPDDLRPQTFEAYARQWLQQRELKPRTRIEYGRLLESHILPALGMSYLDNISPSSVRAWYSTLDPSTPARRAHAYSLVRAIFMTAYADELVTSNPCRIRGAGKAKRKTLTKPATLAELEVIVDATPPPRRMMVLLAAWCGLRFGELAELRRGDIDTSEGFVHVRRAMTRGEGQIFVGDPKSEAGKRTVSVPPHLVDQLAWHLDRHVEVGEDALLFPAQHGGHMAPASLYAFWYPARRAAGRTDLRFHDLRHTGATLAAATGATLAELMARLGHSTTQAAMRYQHASVERDRAIAEALSGFAQAKVVALRRLEGP